MDDLPESAKPYHGPMKPPQPQPQPPPPTHGDGKPWSRWVAESNPTVLCALGKLTEEAGELIKINGRIIAQGLDGFAPTRLEDPRYNGESNIQSLEDEIADMEAWCLYTKVRFSLDRARITERRNRKVDKAIWWLGKPGDPM